MPSSSSILDEVGSNVPNGFSDFLTSPQVRNTLLVLLALLVVYFVYKFLAPYFVRIDNVFFVSGAPGTGKDLLCSDYALKRYTCAMRKYNFAHFVSKLTRKPCKVEKPAFYSSVP